MTMEDWSKRLDAFLEFTERGILQDAGKVSADMAKAHAESDLDKAIMQIEADRPARRVSHKRAPGK